MSAPKTIGIIGAGTMGAGIAQKTAQSGLSVVLMDLGREQVDLGLERIRRMLEKGVERKVFREGEPDRVLANIKGTTSLEDLADCDLVIEAVFEDLDVKRKLLGSLEKIVRKDAVLATNTSSFKVEAVAQGLANPQRVVGLHYFFHPAKNRLLEVIPGKDSDKESVAKCWMFAEATGKTAIHSMDAPGFVVNRFFVPWLNENVRLLEEGVATLPTIEEANKRLFGIGMGPFLLMNVTGVPIAQHAADGLASELGPFYSATELLRKQVASGADWDLEGAADDKGVAAVEERLMGVCLLVAAMLVEEGVSTAEDTDIGAKTGLRWPVGPFGLANKYGVAKAVAAATAVAGKYDLKVPGLLKGRTEPFVLKAANLNVEDGLAVITMNRPDAMNALDPDTVASLAEAFDGAARDPAVKAIVIEGRGKAFVAGADIKYFVDNIDRGAIDDIVSFTRTGQELFLRIDKCEKPVVARLNGMALGGGAELALACDAIIADEKAILGFPETGIGIYPGLGGTQRLVKRCGLPAARSLVLTGDIVPAAKALSLGLVDVVAPAGTSMEAVKLWLSNRASSDGVGAGAAACEALFGDSNVDKLLDGTFEATDKAGEKTMKKIGAKAPIALKMAHELMNMAGDLPIEEGVEKELASLPVIFATKDAREGLGSVGKGRPKFTGE